MLHSLYRAYEEMSKVLFVFIEKKEVLRGPKEIRPTKVTNIGTAIATARNTLAVGHRRRNSRVGEVM